MSSDDSNDSGDDELQGGAFGKHKDAIPVPEYTTDELTILLLYIQQISSSHNLTEDEISKSYTENASSWLTNVLETTLFVYFDRGLLSACLSCPTCPVDMMTYFLRDEPGTCFTVAGFHDEVSFGTFHENVEETFLCLMNSIYAPQDKRWDDAVKMKLFNELHSFMAHLTDVNSKLGSFVILYIPNEGHDLTLAQGALDKALVKRYENVVTYWIMQIRSCLNDMENILHDLKRPSEVHDFWIHKFEVLSGIQEQIECRNLQHILMVLQKSQSYFLIKFTTLCEELVNEVQQSRSCAKFMKLLIEPFWDLAESEQPRDIAPKLSKIIYLMRIISTNCDYYKDKKNTERLVSYLSNEIIRYCTSKIDISKVFCGHPRLGIKMSDMSIDCCISFMLVFQRLVKRLQSENFKETWVFDETKIFKQIEIFIQRLEDIIAICEAMIVFGRFDETVAIPPLVFGCSDGSEFTATCHDMEKTFKDGLRKLAMSSKKILDVWNKDWYEEMSKFNKLLQSLGEIAHNLMTKVFLSVDNVEEALDALTTMQNFSNRKSLQDGYNEKVEEMWKMFGEEIVQVNKDITRFDNEHLGCFSEYSGKSVLLYIKLKKCQRLQDLLLNAKYLPSVSIVENTLKLFELTVDNIKKKIEDYNNDWSSHINPQPLSYLSRTLIKRDLSQKGLLECNIDPLILSIFDEATHFDLLKVPLQSILIQLHPKATQIIKIYNKVVYVVLLYNKILSSLSEKEKKLFSELIKSIDKKISPGMSRLTFNDVLTDEYITDCLKHLDDLQYFVDIYKIINIVNLQHFEEISCGKILDLSIDSVETLEEFKRNFKKSRNVSATAKIEVYKKVIDSIIVMYEGFERYLNNETSLEWIDFIRFIDSIAEYAMLKCAKNSLADVVDLFCGKNWMKPQPFLTVVITLKNQEIVIEPSMEIVAVALDNVYIDIIKSISIFPRLIDKFGLPKSSSFKEFTEIVSEDEDCQNMLVRINEAVEEVIAKTNDFIDSWDHLKPIFESDMDDFMMQHQVNGWNNEQAQENLARYLEASNEIMSQPSLVTIDFLNCDISKLKKSLLECIEKRKLWYHDTEQSNLKYP